MRRPRASASIAAASGSGSRRVSDFMDPLYHTVSRSAIRELIVARKPEKLSHVQTAAIGLIGLTALISIEETLKLNRGETILIQGGAGGVAGFAIALARHIGARVITTASAANHDYVRKLGADEVIDYRSQDFSKVVKNADAVVD